MTGVDEQIKRIESADSGQPRKKVVVLGAGMAGLAAAYELDKLGHSVTVLEAMSRAGGRVWTKRFKRTGEYHELGAMRIPASHDYTRHYIRRVGLDSKLRDFITSHKNKNCFYYLRGAVGRIREAKEKILPLYALSAGELKMASDAVAPAIFGAHLSNAIESLGGNDIEALFGETFLSDRIAELNAQTLGDFLDRRCNTSEAKELIGATTGLEVWWDKALTMFLRDEILGNSEGLQEIAGGLDQLPDYLADKLGRGHISFNTAVVEIRLQEDGVKVLTRPTDPEVWDCPIKDGSEIREVFADYVICTIPFGVLRGLSLSGLSPAKTAAIRNLSYASSTKVLLHCRDRFWERGDEGERIVGGASLSDEITRATYYPSDHATPGFVEVSNHSGKAGFRSLYTTFADPELDAPASSLAEPGPGVLVGSYCWGQDARRLGAMSPDDRAKAVIRVVSKFHPELPDQVDDSETMFWDGFRWARGAFCFLRPNELRTLYPAAIRPEGRLHFAGEHCSVDQGWIQGALISSLRAVEEVVSA